MNNKSTKFAKSSGAVPNDLLGSSSYTQVVAPATAKNYLGVSTKKQDDKESYIPARQVRAVILEAKSQTTNRSIQKFTI